MKKGRHRRYIEARELKHQSDEFDEFFADNEAPCTECEALPGQDHKFWCLQADSAAPVDPTLEDDEATGDLFPS